MICGSVWLRHAFECILSKRNVLVYDRKTTVHTTWSIENMSYMYLRNLSGTAVQSNTIVKPIVDPMRIVWCCDHFKGGMLCCIKCVSNNLSISSYIRLEFAVTANSKSTVTLLLLLHYWYFSITTKTTDKKSPSVAVPKYSSPTLKLLRVLVVFLTVSADERLPLTQF